MAPNRSNNSNERERRNKTVSHAMRLPAGRNASNEYNGQMATMRGVGGVGGGGGDGGDGGDGGERKRCKATTKSGKRCKRMCAVKAKRCSVHSVKRK